MSDKLSHFFFGHGCRNRCLCHDATVANVAGDFVLRSRELRQLYLPDGRNLVGKFVTTRMRGWHVRP